MIGNILKEGAVKALLWISGATLAVTILIMSVPAVADHASGPFYDSEKRVEAVGTVTKFVFRNPHSFLYLDSANADGTTTAWEVEMGTAVMMSRRGWTPDTIQAGDEVKFVGQPSRAPGTFGVCCAELTRPDGTPLRP